MNRAFLTGARTFVIGAMAAVLNLGAQVRCCAGVAIQDMSDRGNSTKTAAGGLDSSVWTVGDAGEPIRVLHVLLSELGYLPLSYHLAVPTAGLYAVDWTCGPVGYWTWHTSDAPSELIGLWNPEKYTEMTKGAVMRFEADHGLRVDGYTGPRVRRALELAAALHLTAGQPYRSVIVDPSIPQRLWVWEDGRGVVFRSLCSTGVPAAPTQPGVHAIFLRSREQTMQGIGPSGRPYRVEHVPYVSFFYGEQAVHGFRRPTYGIPQSAGCVELPISAAQRVWQLSDYGTLVIISRPTNGTK